MKAVLEFELPEDREAFETAVRADKWRFALMDIDQELRTLVKHVDMPESVREKLTNIRNTIPTDLNLEDA